MGATSLDKFLDGCCTEIERRAALLNDSSSIFLEGAQVFRNALDAATVVAASPSEVPVAGLLPAVPSSPLVDLLKASTEIPWAPSPRLDDGGEGIALGLVDRVRDLGEMICGVALVAPGARYPEHSHPPQEIYLPLAGNGSWRFGGSEQYVPLSSDALLYNNPGDRHGTIAGDELEVALYILW